MKTASEIAPTDSDIYGTFDGRPEGAPSDGVTSTPSNRSRLFKVGILGSIACTVGVFLSASPPSSNLFSSYIPTWNEAAHPDLPVDVQGVSGYLSSQEASFVSGMSTGKIREYQRAYSSKPHICGSEQDYKTALYTLEQFKSFGLDAEIVEYETLLSYPIKQRLSIVSPTGSTQELNLKEGIVEEDACTTDPTAVDPFLAYSPSGNVTASIVYVNYARPEDFEYLISRNVTLKGKIALTRYGGQFRGLKVMLAEDYGMAGVIIYSDPADDGYAVGEVYPDGPMRPKDSFQRGSIQYPSIDNGDPLTPGFASKPGAPYLTIEEAQSLPRIPALPLSYGQAIHILQAMDGEQVPSDWQGALPLTYRFGDDSIEVNMDLEMDNSIYPIWDVIATIEGSEEPEEVVLMGNHRDAWVCGGVDPSSGTASLVEVARSFGRMMEEGWRPRRTIKVASWDGEEYSLLGSTEYAEDHASYLKEHAIAYLNVDAFSGDLVTATALPSITQLLLDAAKGVPAIQFEEDEDVGNAVSIFDQWEAAMTRVKEENGGHVDGFLQPDYMIGFLNSGSDDTVFHQTLGVASAVMSAADRTGGAYGVYHSTMDSLMYVEKFSDPQYATHLAIGQWWGVVAMRLASSKVLPLDFSTYALVMAQDLPTFQTRLLERGLNVDFMTLYAAVEAFSISSATFHAKIAKFESDASIQTKEMQKHLNEKLKMVERHLLLEDGLPHRKWFKHTIFGPGYYEGYSGTTYPGIDDALAFDDDAAAIQKHVDDVAAAISNAAAFLLDES